MGGPAVGGEFRFSGYLAMQSPNEAPAQNSSFYKAVTGDPEGTGKPSEFFADFATVSNPTIAIVQGDQSKNLTPPITGAFKYELRIRPPTAVPGAAPGAVGAAR